MPDYTNREKAEQVGPHARPDVFSTTLAGFYLGSPSTWKRLQYLGRNLTKVIAQA